MAVLNSLDLTRVAESSNQQVLREILSTLFWSWYEDNKTQTITIRRWFFNWTVTLEDLRPLFVLLFGNHAQTP